MNAPGKPMRIVVRVLSFVLAAFFLMAGVPKLLGVEAHVQHFVTWGYSDWFRLVVGAAEVAAAVLLLVPRLAHVGAAAIAVIMAGATYTHVIRVPEEAGRAPLTVILMVIAALVAYVRYRETSATKQKAPVTV
jgi:putative oxidoreductase